MNSLKILSQNLYQPIFFKQKNIPPEDKKPINKTYLAEVSVVGLTALGVLGYRNYANRYKIKLAADLSKELGQKISTKKLKSIMTNSVLIRELSKLKEENFAATKENIKNGTFLADLHSHSNFSDGKASIETILNEASEYGNKLNKINGKKFIFAISDHDGVDGVKEALKIIVKNPEKFKNVRFVPAAELSFVFPCQKNSERFRKFGSDVQMPEMLVYNINPFSKTTEEFFESIYNSRQKQISKAVNECNFYYHNSNFSSLEFDKFFTPPGKKPCFLNQHWRIWNYIHTKSRVVNMAKEQNIEPKVLYEKIVNDLKQEKKYMTPYELDEYIKRNNIQTDSKIIDENLKSIIIKEIFPKKINENELEKEYEKDFKDIVSYAKKENAILCFAHPGFTMQNFTKENCLSGMQKLIKESKGRIKFAEKYHQAYPLGKEIMEGELREYNEILDKLKLINIGGRDNHKNEFIKSD